MGQLHGMGLAKAEAVGGSFRIGDGEIGMVLLLKGLQAILYRGYPGPSDYLAQKQYSKTHVTKDNSKREKVQETIFT